METAIFKELGFTEREIKTYIALLELGTSTIGPLTKKTNLQATKVYETLAKLQALDLGPPHPYELFPDVTASNPKEVVLSISKFVVLPNGKV